MASSLLHLLDKSASALDDVTALTKLATKKAAGVLGDDLALSAQQVSGVSADRELPVVRAVAKGSEFNKLILVVAALAISAPLPWLITPPRMLGGAFGLRRAAARSGYCGGLLCKSASPALRRLLASPMAAS